MTHATIRFQYDTARFELYLDKLTGLPAPNIRKLFKLMLSQAVQADAFRTVEQPDSH